MLEVIDEFIDVSAIFRNGRIKPISFIWNRERYKIQEITYTWNDCQGEAKLYYFSVSDGVLMNRLYQGFCHSLQGQHQILAISDFMEEI